MKPLTQDEWGKLACVAMTCVVAWGLCGILGLTPIQTAYALGGTLVSCAIGEWVGPVK